MERETFILAVINGTKSFRHYTEQVNRIQKEEEEEEANTNDEPVSSSSRNQVDSVC